MYKIGNIGINNPVAVAPMAGISNAAFRVKNAAGASVGDLCPVNLGGGNYGVGIYGYGTAGWRVVFDHNGRAGFGIVFPTERVDVDGNIKASGHLNTGGGVVASGTLGATNKVLSGGSVASWANAIDLITQAELRTKLGGKTIIAMGSNVGAVTLSPAEPDASYQVAGIAYSYAGPFVDSNMAWPAVTTIIPIAVTSKTATGFTVSPQAAGAFWVAYR